MSSGQIAVPSAWGPLRQSLFRALWIASVASNIGTWIQNVGAEWLMTTLAPSPMMVALMQTAETLPIFLLAIPAGAIADVIDRRLLLLIAQGWMLLAAAALSLLTLVGATTPWVLLLLTFSPWLGRGGNGTSLASGHAGAGATLRITHRRGAQQRGFQYCSRRRPRRLAVCWWRRLDQAQLSS